MTKWDTLMWDLPILRHWFGCFGHRNVDVLVQDHYVVVNHWYPMIADNHGHFLHAAD